jgi:CubicO group peptidase (beta-lactamase class C family)
MSSARRGFSRAERLMDAAAAERVFESAVLLCADDGAPVLHRAWGRARLDTVFDLASLTKPLATTAVLIQLCAEGKLRVRQRLAELLPELARRETRAVELRHLLAHTSGLPAWRPFYQELVTLPPEERRPALARLAAREPLEAEPGSRTTYSDLGFILLAAAIERVTGTRLDALVQHRLCDPLRLERTGFVDLERPRAVAALRPGLRFAPTERCPWRRRRLEGEVHDDNAWAIGGVSGHAGLFSTAFEVHLLCRELCAGYQGERSLFEPEPLRTFLDARLGPGGRALGWDRPAARGSSCGRHFGPQSVGHLGFTGTSLWVDLDLARWVVLLTNRVYYGREPNRLRPFRPRLHDALLGAL